MKNIIYLISVFMMAVSFSGCSSEESKDHGIDLGVCTNPQCTCPKPCQCGSGCRCGMDGNPSDINKK